MAGSPAEARIGRACEREAGLSAEARTRRACKREAGLSAEARTRRACEREGGSNSVVESQPSKLLVAGSIPVSRSNLRSLRELRLASRLDPRLSAEARSAKAEASARRANCQAEAVAPKRGAAQADANDARQRTRDLNGPM